MEQLITVTEAARHLQISTRRVRQFVAEGLLQEAGRVGRGILLHRTEVERLAKEGWRGRRPGRRPSASEGSSD